MSDSEEESFCFFGKPLEQYDEDSIPKKRPISVEEQIATDDHGRRRFHGAFTGGFSAGFFNTVGSLEGWLPREFKSSRSEKSDKFAQKPEDFMDDEDIGEFGIAPQVVRATSEYANAGKSSDLKRKRMPFSDGPIPGEPVLHSLLTSGNETVGYLLLKNMGINDKIDAAKAEDQEEMTSDPSSGANKVYGCEMPKNIDLAQPIKAKKAYILPSIYNEFLEKPKSNSFGLGYVGLQSESINLFAKSGSLVVNEKNKKLSISGQAFGVGAFEEEDDDIYAKEDMTRYDFEMTKEKKANPLKKLGADTVLDGTFIKCRQNVFKKEIYPPPVIPHSFTGKYKVKKSRFEPIPEEKVERKSINADVRARYLGETPVTPQISKIPTENVSKPVETKPKKSTEALIYELKKENQFGLIFDRFVSSSNTEDTHNILEKVETLKEFEHGTQEMRDAVKMKMFGPLTRVTTDWQPNSIVCKRFNVPEPNSGPSMQKRKRTKHLIFEYQKEKEEDPILKPGLTQRSTNLVESENLEQNIINLDDTEITNTETNATDANVIKIEDEEETLVKQPEEVPKQQSFEPKQEPTKPEEIITIIDETEKLNIEEKTDLFKAVFLSSSDESEASDTESQEKEEEVQKTRQTELQENVLSEQLLPKIKPLKNDGILSNLDFRIVFKKPDPSQKNNSAPEIPEAIVPNNCYGPEVPKKLETPPVKAVQSVEVSLKKGKSGGDSSDSDQWIEKDLEKDQMDNKKNKKSKHKKHKKEHKKKHKHDKKKKKH